MNYTPPDENCGFYLKGKKLKKKYVRIFEDINKGKILYCVVFELRIKIALTVGKICLQHELRD